MVSNIYWKDRGYPWEYDAGPAKNLCWPRLFSETPNYRQLSKTKLGREKFRWHFGPMYYRGRLKAKSVRVVIIGQEGAQDESLAHRSFSGGTGARMQHFLNFIGVTYSYLFLNTFVYPIFGQYSSNIKWLAQDGQSPIVKHRHEIFNYILKKNDVHLIVAVGTAAKESVKTWVESRGGSCPDGTSDLSTGAGHFLDPKTRIVGVSPDFSVVDIIKLGVLHQTKDYYKIVVTPLDEWGNHLDPGYAQKIKIHVSQGSHSGGITDQMNGDYSTLVPLSKSQDPGKVKISVMIGDVAITKSLAKQIICSDALLLIIIIVLVLIIILVFLVYCRKRTAKA